MFLPHIESIGDGRGFSIVCLGSQGLGSLWAPDIFYKQGWQQRAFKQIHRLRRLIIFPERGADIYQS